MKKEIYLWKLILIVLVLTLCILYIYPIFLPKINLVKLENYSVFSGEGVYEYHRNYILNENEKNIYDEIKEASLQFKGEYTTAVKKITRGEFERAFKAVISDHPEIFWLESYKLKLKVFSNKNLDTRQRINLEFGYTEKEAIETKSKIEVEYNRIIGEAVSLGTNSEKIKYVHDELIQIGTYTIYEEKDKIRFQNIVSIFETGESVCSGYAYGFKFIMDKLDIKSITMTSSLKSGVAHIWNMVELDGEWFYIDITWDEKAGYNYFLVGREILEESHILLDGYPD